MAIVDIPRVKLVVCGLDGSLPPGSGEIPNPSNRQFAYHINASRTAQFTVNIDNPRVDYLMNNDCLLKLYRLNRLGNWDLLLAGDIIQAEEFAQGDVGQVTVVASDPFWRLQYRFIGLGVDSRGRGTGSTFGTSASPEDISTIIGDILAELNTSFWSGISWGTSQTSTNTYVGPVYAQNAGETIQQLTTILGAPDLEFAPSEPTDIGSGDIRIAVLNTYASLGQNRPNCLFEYGMGAFNCQSYDRLLSKDGMCNQAYSLPSGFPGTSSIGDSLVMAEDLTSIFTRGLFQDILPNDLTSVGVRTELANENVAVRKQARQQYNFTPSVDNPDDFMVDYRVGDTVVCRAMVNDILRVNGTARIYGVDLSWNDEDAETASLVLIPGG